MTSMLLTFVSLCIGTVLIQRIRGVQRLGPRLSIWLIALSLGVYALWFGINAYSPPATIMGHWWMFRIALVGFLCTLLSTIQASRNLAGARGWIIALVSFLIGLLHFFAMISSIPLS